MSKIKNAFHDEIEIRALFEADSNVSEKEAFKILHEAGVTDIAHINAALNTEYLAWQYHSIK